MPNCPSCHASVPSIQALRSRPSALYICACGAKLWLAAPLGLGWLTVFATVFLLAIIKRFELVGWHSWIILVAAIGLVWSLNIWVKLQRGRMIVKPDLPLP